MAESRANPSRNCKSLETFDRAQELLKDRTTERSGTPRKLSGQSLLVGNVFCGHCRNRLTLTTSGCKHTRKDGSVYREVRCRYQCHYNVRHPGECDGQSGYGMKKLDGIVEDLIRYQLSRICAASGEKLIAEQNQKNIDLLKARHHIAATQLSEKKSELADYQKETIKVIRGESRLSADLLNEMVQKTQEEVVQLEKTVADIQRELDSHLASAKEEQKEYQKLKSWADLYDNCSFEAKKMIVQQLIKAVYVYRDYTLEVEFNVPFEEFQHLATENGGELPAVETVLPLSA